MVNSVVLVLCSTNEFLYNRSLDWRGRTTKTNAGIPIIIDDKKIQGERNTNVNEISKTVNPLIINPLIHVLNQFQNTK